ncbi:MAG: MATE family efflux transporter [Prevotella sp.]|nr:MATE family efflux transporter [Prevotella sp.]
MTNDTTSISNRRSSLIRKNILVMFCLKGWYGLIFLLIVPLTLQCLGGYANGLWLAISTLLIWIDQLDIGLGNGLRNKLAEYIAKGDSEKARQCVSTTLLMLIAVIIPVAIVAFILINALDVYELLGTDTTHIPGLRGTLVIALSLVCATFVLKIIGNIYYALQMPAVSQGLTVLGQTVVLGITFLLSRGGTCSLLTIAVVNTLSPLVIYAIAWPLTFMKYHPELSPRVGCFRKEMVRELLSMGIEFFLIQIGSGILVLTSSILVANMFTPEAVNPYQIGYKYFNLTIMVFTVIAMPFWSATTDAYTRGDMEWIRRSMTSIRKILLLLTALMVVLVLISQPIYRIWVPGINIPVPLTILMGLYTLVIIYSSAYSFFLNGFGLLRLQVIMTLTAAVLLIPIAVILGRWLGINGITLALCLVNTPGMIVNMIQYNKVIKGTAKGIWIK